MFDYSSEHVGDPMAVVYIERVPELSTGPNGEEVRTTRTSEQVISVATINGVLGKEFQTSGLDSAKEAADLALLLRAGALAAPMDFVEQRVVGPSLGKENVDRGLTAVLYSFGFALVFFLVYYRKELGPDGKPMPILLNKRVIATGDQLVTARSGYDQRSGTPQVSVTLNGIGGQRMFDFTSENVGKPMAVVYVERVPEVTIGPDGEEIRTTRTSEQVISVANIQGVVG